MDLRHDRLSTYGIGADLSVAEWDNIIRQLIHLGYLVQDFTRFGALALSPAARPVLRGEARVILGLPRTAVVEKEKPTPTRKNAALADTDRALFEELRALRKQMADQAGVPPFVVFSDATLVAMAAARPRDERELRQIGGVGDYKLRTYGAPFLAVINRHDRITDSLAEQVETDGAYPMPGA
jgi:ATP-dependent DNA helicase RecQ